MCLRSITGLGANDGRVYERLSRSWRAKTVEKRARKAMRQLKQMEAGIGRQRTKYEPELQMELASANLPWPHPVPNVHFTLWQRHETSLNIYVCYRLTDH